MTTIRPVRVSHINVVVEDLPASIAQMQQRFDADLLMEMPQREWNACLIEMGRVIFELFAPPTFLLNARYGPHYLGVEYQANLDEVREAIAAHGVRIVRDIGVALHTHPADTLGIAFEFYDGHFHDNEALLGRPMKSAPYWRDEHALGLAGLRGYTVAVADGNRAGAFLQSFLGAQPVYDEPRRGIAARALGFQIADSIVEVLAPVAEGRLAAHLAAHGEGIFSTLLDVADLARAEAFLRDRGVTLSPGTGEGRRAVAAEYNDSIILEFCA